MPSTRRDLRAGARDGRDRRRAARRAGGARTNGCGRSTSAPGRASRHAEVEQRFPDGRRSDGETREQHAGRVRAAVAAIAHEHAGRRILIVTHGGSIRALLGGSGDVPSAWVQNCGVVELEFRDGRLVEPARSTG